MKKTVAVTGASGGLGAEMARQIAEKGWTPILLARSIDKLQMLKEELESQYQVKTYIYMLDVQQVNEIESVFQKIKQEVGFIDVLINNAGFGVFELFKDEEFERLESMFKTNVLGLMKCTKTVLPDMIERKHGHIINISSQAGKIATPKSAAYSATKHAVLGFTNSLRMEVEDDGIAVTSVNPGPIKTNFFNIADKSGSYVQNVGKYMLNPEKVAAKIVAAIEKPVREINLPKWMNFTSKLYNLAPTIVEALGKDAFKQK